MDDVMVTCVVREQHAYDPHYGITHVGGKGWTWTRAAVVESIQNRTNTFYTKADGRRADVQVVSGLYGPYLRTHRDGVATNNLLELDRCPV